jgi:hypothetical protein
MTMVSQTEYNARCAIINNTNRVIVSIKDRIREQGIGMVKHQFPIAVIVNIASGISMLKIKKTAI